VLTRNGRVAVNRRHYHLAGRGSVRPMDIYLGLGDGSGGPGVPAVTRSVRRVMCLLNLHSGSFDHTSQCLSEAAHLSASKELVRQVVEAEGRAVLDMQARMLPTAWNVDDCKITDDVTRMYIGCDGVKVPMITDEEKRKRRENTVAKRKARTGRNPQTGETIKIKASKAPKFTPGKSFKEAIGGKKK